MSVEDPTMSPTPDYPTSTDDRLESLTRRIKVIVDFYQQSRAAGHSHAVASAARLNPNVLVLTPERSGGWLARLTGSNAQVVTFSELSGLVGKQNPLLLDNSAVMELLEETLDLLAHAQCSRAARREPMRD